MLGKKEVWYFGFAVLSISYGFFIALKDPAALTGYAAILGTVTVPLYGGALGKVWAEARSNGNGKPNGQTPTQ